MKLTISEIEGIKPREGKMHVQCYLDRKDAERAVCEVWELYGDEFLVDLLKSEGWSVAPPDQPEQNDD